MFRFARPVRHQCRRGLPVPGSLAPSSLSPDRRIASERPTGIDDRENQNEVPCAMKKLYAIAAAIVLNTAALLVAFNVVAAFFVADRDDGPIEYSSAMLIERYGFDVLKKAYPGWTDENLRVLLTESSNWLLEYEPFTQFRPATRSDTYITIDPAGFRVSPPQGPWPPDKDAINLFVFGSSTTMGAGTPDVGTIPARLQARIHSDCRTRVNVYNFGRGLYFSTQERILFAQLLLSGVKPDMAVFVDGMTEFYYPDGTPELTARLSAFIEAANHAKVPRQKKQEGFASAFIRMLEALPAYRLLQESGMTWLTPARAAEFEAPAGGEAAARAVVERWRTNRRMIQAVATAFEVPVLFAWAPGPTYGYDIDHMNLQKAGKLDFGRLALSATGYRQMAELHAGGELGEDFLWLGDMQRGVRENLYVDAAHYDAAFSSRIADALFDRLVERHPFVCMP